MRRGLRKWFEDTRDVYGRNRLSGLLHGLYYAYVGLWLTVTSRVTPGRHVYDHDWDLLIVLDACRVDALEAVADEYEFVEDVGSVPSVGSTSSEWLAHTFDESVRSNVEETAYVTANPHSEVVLRDEKTPPQYFAAPFARPKWNVVDPTEFAELAEVWRTGRSDRFDITPPRETTERAIEVGREAEAERLMVHYMQPHAPYIGEHVDRDGELPPELAEPFDHLRGSELTRDEAWDAYLDNLRLALDEVALLLENVDADDVVITADHGESFGEMGFYEHPVGCPHSAVKYVPWVETTATDQETVEPTSEVERVGADVDVEKQLQALGYQ